MSFLKGKTLLLTGGGRSVLSDGSAGSIGYGIATAYAKEGANLVITGRNLQKLQEAKEELERLYGVKVLPVQADVSAGADNAATAKMVVEKAMAEFGRIDVLINNFGMSSPGQDLDFAHTAPDVFLDTVTMNLRSVFLASQAAVKHMAQNGGSIINISSVGGLVPDISQVAYGTSKAAINHLTKLIAVQEAKHHIRCNAVLPGMTATEAIRQHLTEEFRELFTRHIPLGRIGLSEEIAEAVCYFASDASAYTTGQILTVSGGFGLATPVYGDFAQKTIRR